MSDCSEGPAGSLARIGDYDECLDASDRTDNDETPVTKQSSEIASIDTNKVAVAEASPPNRRKHRKSHEKADDEDSNQTDDNDSSEAEDVEMTEEDNKKKGDVEVKEEDVEDKEPEVKIQMEDFEMEEESSDTSQKDDNISPSSFDADLVKEVMKTEEEEDEAAESSDKVHKKRSSKDSECSSSEDSSGGSTSESEYSDNDHATDAPSNATKQPNPWETLKRKPVNGIVQPRTSPPTGKPTRHTNCLDFVLFTIVRKTLMHKLSWPFHSPVDSESLDIPDYHDIISKPMDFRTIERRLRNLYYWSAADAIKDIKKVSAGWTQGPLGRRSTHRRAVNERRQHEGRVNVVDGERNYDAAEKDVQ
ncbi:unnamed protein product [Caenorhabditis sp. 36 PRJEB53466]|nr:unnamed protein product [Caenorhabditis sp. 36 PRJEB53466]